MSTQRRHGQRTHATVATALAASLLAAGLAGCGSGGEETADANGTLVFGISADPAQMVPWTATSTQSIQVLSQIYSPLLNTDADGVPEAGLAELPEISEDGKTYTFTIQDGVTFG
ncbi:MAG TPA: hypothetical protein VIP58_07995, partial [Nocardioides sp.]